MLAKYNLMNLLVPDSWGWATPPAAAGAPAGLEQRGWCIEVEPGGGAGAAEASESVKAAAAHAIGARRGMAAHF